MRTFILLSVVVLGALLQGCSTPQRTAEPFSTNKVAVANGQKTFQALLVADGQSKTNIQALIGSQVVFYPTRGPKGTNDCVLTLPERVFLLVEFSPPYQWDKRLWEPGSKYPSDMFYSTAILGTLKSVDFEKRVITIVAKQQDWIVTGLW
jgi:hypothetical protein